MKSKLLTNMLSGLQWGDKKLIDIRWGSMENMFGSLGRRTIQIPREYDFIPGKDGQVMMLNDDDGANATYWKGLETTEMQWWAYNYCSPLAAVIDRLAEADSNGVLEYINEDDGTKVKNFKKSPRLKRIMDLLNNPNPIQTFQEWDNEQISLCKTFGYCPVWAVGPGGPDKSYSLALFNLNPYICKPEINKDYDPLDEEQRKIGPIKNWILTINGKQHYIDSADVFVVKDGMITDPYTFLPISKVAGLDFFVSNICAAMEADNVLLKRKGPLGIFSWDPGKDMAGTPVLDPTSIDDLQNMLRKYSLSLDKLQHIVSKVPVKWSSTSFNLRDLMTKETIRSGIDGICDRMGYPAELMSGKNATYENRNSAERFLYQNNVIPFSKRRMLVINKFFALEDQGSLLNLNYNHLPVLQDDILKAGEAYNYEAQGLEIEWKNGMINWNQWQVAKNREAVVGMDIYYDEWLKLYGKNIIKLTNGNKNSDKSSTPADKKAS